MASLGAASLASPCLTCVHAKCATQPSARPALRQEGDGAHLWTASTLQCAAGSGPARVENKLMGEPAESPLCLLAGLLPVGLYTLSGCARPGLRRPSPTPGRSSLLFRVEQGLIVLSWCRASSLPRACRNVGPTVSAYRPKAYPVARRIDQLAQDRAGPKARRGVKPPPEFCLRLLART